MSVVKGDWARGNACEILFSKQTIEFNGQLIKLYHHDDFDVYKSYFIAVKYPEILSIPNPLYKEDEDFTHLYDLISYKWNQHLNKIIVIFSVFTEEKDYNKIGLSEEEIKHFRCVCYDEHHNIIQGIQTGFSLFELKYDVKRSVQSIIIEIIERLKLKNFDEDFYKNSLNVKLFDTYFKSGFAFDNIVITFE